MSCARSLAGTEGCTTSRSGATPSRATGAMSLRGLNAVEGNSCALMLKGPGGATNSSCPSGGARSTTSAPMLPFAPGRFSTMNGWPNALANSSAAMRASTSTEPPGGLVAMRGTGRSGQGCAGVAPASARPAASSSGTYPAAVSLPSTLSKESLMKALIFAISLVAMSGAAVSGENSTHRLHCTGQSFEAIGLQNFNPAMSDFDAPLPRLTPVGLRADGFYDLPLTRGFRAQQRCA